jgi:NADH:ubiquinone oxidoreductase subunit F (NADH-binding)
MIAAEDRFKTAAAATPLIGGSTAAQLSLDAHLAEHGSLPTLSARDVVQFAKWAGLTGHGGAGFPLWRKLDAVARSRGRAVVVGNGAEGEPASGKDQWLLTHRPHLVLDGLQLAAQAVGGSDVFLYANELLPLRQLSRVIAERDRAQMDSRSVEVVAAPDAFISGEESSVVSHLSGAVALPRFKQPPVFERGVRGRPTLVSNVETLAHLALIARHGPDWFRRRGTSEQPGTMLFTVTGAVANPGVVEAPHGARLADVIDLAGGATSRLQAVLIGGYHGAWLSPDVAARARVSAADLAPVGASPGAGVVVALGEHACGLMESSRVLGYLAREAAGQCGPCLNGLPRIAELSHALVTRAANPAAVAELHRIAGLIERRGACHHPDGSVRFLRSALRVFCAELELHHRGRCSRTADDAVLPTPRRSVRDLPRTGS